jgi:hypothetical protein
MSAAHTPGPWLVEQWRNNQDDITGWRVTDSKGETLPESEYSGDSEEAQANARLIAAAPDLLHDLREAASILRKYEALHRAKGTDESTAKAEVNAALAVRFEATIAKATGETP